jgi:glycerol-3-phosphate acyltransferase PlsX
MWKATRFLKVLEGTAHEVVRDLRATLKGGLLSRLGALLIRAALRQVAAKYDYAEHGGALLLGTNGVCIVAHGCSDRRAMARAIVVGAQGAETRAQDHMAEAFRLQNAAAAKTQP